MTEKQLLKRHPLALAVFANLYTPSAQPVQPLNTKAENRSVNINKWLATSLLPIGLLGCFGSQQVYADAAYHSLAGGNFSQNWANAGLITISDDWSGVPSIIGYRGDDITGLTGVDPQTLLGEGTVTVDVNANQTAPNTFGTGGVTEFAIADPTIALTGSGTADAPYIQIHLDTTNRQNVAIAYNLRDLDGSVDNAAQPVALQYRIGNAGDFTNVAAGYVADATTGPSLATQVTPISVTLPAAVNNQPQVQVRVMTTNAVGNDEWVGIDDITVNSDPLSATAGITLTQTGGSTDIIEGGATDTYAVVLNSQPAADVTVSLAGDSQATASVSTLTFTPANWNVAQTVTVTAVDDVLVEGAHTGTISHTPASSDASYNGLSIGGITANITDNDAVPSLSINDVSQSEGNGGISNYTFTVNLSSVAPAGGVSFDIATADNSALAGSDYTSQSLTSQSIPAGSSNYTFDVAVNGDTAIETDEAFLVNVTNVSGATVTDGQGVGTIVNDDVAPCSATDTPIGQIQGSGTAAALTGTQTVQGVVVGDYEGASPALRGFFVQNTPANSDGDDATSDAIFVFNNSNDTVSLGQVVQVTGTVAEFQDQTQMTLGAVESCGGTDTITPVSITLPIPAAGYLERFEGMLVKFPQTLHVTEHFQLGRFGQVVMSSSQRLAQPTNIATPGAAALSQQAANNLNRIIVDDELQNQNRDPIVFGRGGNPLTASNTLRGGDTATDIVGIMTYTWAGNAASGNAYRLRPINALNGGVPNFIAANPRPTVPAQVNGTLKVASANLLNFFDDVTNCSFGLGGAPSTSICRGAENQTELDRQWPKTVENLVGTGAAVIVVNEIQNDGYGADSAIQFLVNKLNAKAGAGTYAFIDVDAATSETNALGTDAIKVGMIYKPAIVTPVGTTAALNTGALGIFRTGSGDIGRSRPSLAQAFEENATEARFIAVANHFKSKGSSCADNVSLLSFPILSTIDITNDTDAGDGQGNCNKTRTAAAQELMALLATDPTGTADPDILIVGDLNSYAKEDPVTTIKNGGYTNLIESRIGMAAYSYVFDGQWGYLDHALASTSLTPQVQDVLEWHINADEPGVLDYNTNFKSAGQLASLYAADAFRTSDHDPIIVGLNLTAPPLNAISGTRFNNRLTGTSGRDVITGFAGIDTLTGGGDRDQFVYLTIDDGIDIITDFTVNTDKIVLTSLLQSLSIVSANPLAAGYVVCSSVGNQSQSMISIDRDANGPLSKRSLVLVPGVACSALAVPANFKF